MRTVRFSELPRLDESKMNKQWIRYPRKKTELDGVVYLLKVQGEKSRWQVQADQLKVAFDLPPLGVIEVFDEELKQTGCLIPWFENRGHLAQVPWKDWATQQNLRRLVQIGVFDGVIGNSDRVVSNVLVRPDDSLMPIDEGEQERFEWVPGPLRPRGGDWVLARTSPIRKALWVKYRKQLLMLIATTLKDRAWLNAWLDYVQLSVPLLPDGVVRQYYLTQLARLDRVVEETVWQIQNA